jgi:integrase/recombinase XerD
MQSQQVFIVKPFPHQNLPDPYIVPLKSPVVVSSASVEVEHTHGHKDCPACQSRSLIRSEVHLADMHFGDAFKAWLAARLVVNKGETSARCIAENSEKTYREYAWALEKFFGDLALNEIHDGHIRCYQENRVGGGGVEQNRVLEELDLLVRIMRLAQVWTADLDSVLDLMPTAESHTLRQLVDLHLVKLKAKDNGEDSMAKNKRELERFVEFATKRSKFSAIEVDEIFLLQYSETWKQAYPSGVTRNLVRQRLLQFLKFCVQLGELRVVPDIPKAKQKREPTLPLTDEEYTKLLQAASTGQRKVRSPVSREVRRAVVLLMRWSGAAITDATMMKRASIFFDETKGIYRCKYRRQKTGVLINNPLPNEVAQEILKTSKLCSSKTHLFQIDGEEGLNSGSKRRWVDWFSKAFAKIGMPDGHSHQLRDTFAVGLLLKGVSLEYVSKALGHTSIKTTERYYSPWIKERQDLLDEIILGAVREGELL